MKTDSDYWSCGLFMTCALRTPSAPSLNARFPTHALTTVRTAVQTAPWYAVRSGCNQRNSTAQRQRGTLVSTSERCLNQTSRSSPLRPSRRNLAPPSPVTLPHRSGKFWVTPCTKLLWLSLGRGPQNHMTGSKPNQL